MIDNEMIKIINESNNLLNEEHNSGQLFLNQMEFWGRWLDLFRFM